MTASEQGTSLELCELKLQLPSAIPADLLTSPHLLSLATNLSRYGSFFSITQKVSLVVCHPWYSQQGH